MHGLNLALLVFAAFWAGAFVALLVRAMIEDAAQRRLARETLEASSRIGDAYVRIRPLIAQRPPRPPTKPRDAWQSVTPPRA